MALDKVTKIDRGGINTTSNYTIGAADIGSNIQLGNAGVITATSFSGGGASFTGDTTFSGNVSIGGTLTYEDVKNVDSVGIITAQKDIHVGAGVSAVGVGTFSAADVDDFVTVGNNIQLGNAGVITATKFVGDGSDLTSLPAGLGTALSQDATSALNSIYYVNDTLHVTSNMVVAPPSSSSNAYTQYSNIEVSDNINLTVGDNVNFIPDVLDLFP